MKIIFTSTPRNTFAYFIVTHAIHEHKTHQTLTVKYIHAFMATQYKHIACIPNHNYTLIVPNRHLIVITSCMHLCLISVITADLCTAYGASIYHMNEHMHTPIQDDLSLLIPPFRYIHAIMNIQNTVILIVLHFSCHLAYFFVILAMKLSRYCIQI